MTQCATYMCCESPLGAAYVTMKADKMYRGFEVVKYSRSTLNWMLQNSAQYMYFKITNLEAFLKMHTNSFLMRNILCKNSVEYFDIDA